MSKLDVAKEKIAYLKLWLGIAVVTDISLFSWLLTSGRQAPAVLLFGALVAVGCMTAIALYIHKRIEKAIAALEDL
jgi:HAMP domain-containing protein